MAFFGAESYQFFSLFLSALPDAAACELIVCVAFNAIHVADVQKAQLASSAKVLGLKNTQKDKPSLIRAVAQGLLAQGYIKVLGDLTNTSRKDIKENEAILKTLHSV